MLPYAPWLCWLIPIIGAILTPLFALAHRRLRDYAPGAFVGASVIFSFSMMPDVHGGTLVNWKIPWVTSLGINLGVLIDPLSVLMASLVSGIGLLVLMFSLEYMRGDPGLTRYWFFTQLFIGGMVMVVMADNLLQLYVGWEVVGVCCYALVTFWYKNPENARYGLKTFLLLRVGDLSLLMSILIMYFYSSPHTFNFLDIDIAKLSGSGLLLVTFFLYFGGAMGKSAQFPLHVWLPDAMAATPASFNATTEVLAGVYLVARIFPMLHAAEGYGELTIFFLAVAWIGAFTALFGASMAMVQKNIVKLLAYSIISQYAYMIVAFGVSGLMTDPAAGYLASIFHKMTDTIISGLLFLSAAAILHRIRSQDMFDMGELKVHMPITFMCMLIGALATIGIPPLSGFWSEEAIYSATWELAQEAGRLGQSALMFSAYGLFFFLMVTAAITTFYIVRMMGLVFNRESKHVEKLEDEGEPINEVSPIMLVPMVILASATIIMGVFAPFIITRFHEFFSPPPLYQSMVYKEVIDILKRAFLSPSFGITCVALVIGGYSAYQLYITCQSDPVKLIEEHRFLKKTYDFLWNRCYINALYSKVADGTKAFSNIAYERLELNIDALNYFIADLTTSFSRRFRKTHTGVLSHNMLAVFMGIVLLIILLFIFGGRIS
ncbi:MAG: NADH-quinone oxidoreductase subunit L [Thermoproteota archaeon]|nr:NADH-quinone oxidoreductase subunit L [Thermoproteota archaeon]